MAVAEFYVADLHVEFHGGREKMEMLDEEQ